MKTDIIEIVKKHYHDKGQSEIEGIGYGYIVFDKEEIKFGVIHTYNPQNLNINKYMIIGSLKGSK